MCVNQGGEQIVRGRDGVEIAVEVQIDLFAGLDLRFAAIGSPSFHAENRAERRLTGCDYDFLAEESESLGKPDGGDGFAFPGSGWRGGGYENELAAAFELGVVQQLEADLATRSPQRFEVFLGNFKFARDIANRKKCARHKGENDPWE